MNPEHTTSLSPETVRHIAELSRLALSPEEESLFQKELEKVLNAFHSLTQVPMPSEFSDSRSSFLFEYVACNQTEPTEQISHMAPDISNNSLSTQRFMADTPDNEGVFVRVPIILNQENWK